MLLCLCAGCTVGPNYRQPTYPVPPVFRGAAPDTEAHGPSLGDLAWWQMFQDEQLQAFLRTALAQNYDLRIAATRILDARAQLTIARSQQFPAIEANVRAPYNRTEGKNVPLTVRETFAPVGSLDLSFEIDLWGRLRRTTEAAWADLLASEEARWTVVTTLISDVATTYFQLRELDLELEIAHRTLSSRQDSLQLVQARAEDGLVSLLEVRQAEILVTTAAQTIPDVERRMVQTENLLSILLGQNPDMVPRGRALLDQFALPEVPVGLPSALLARRPDIRQAEQQLIAANARIGAAKALFFPQVTLTGSAGVSVNAADGTFFGPSWPFAVGPSVTLPIFNAGRIRAGVESAEARQQEALLRYQQTIQEAFREVADALVEYRKRQEFRVQQESLTKTLQDATSLSHQRYEGGVTSYLEVLDTERQLFTAELNLAQAQRDEQLAVVQLYKALGGGWSFVGNAG
jgi:multidrug efflux system outer membrane protein